MQDTAEFVLAQHRRIGCAAATLGDRDLLLGRTLLEKLRKKSPFPFLVANLVDAETGKPVFEDHIIVESGGVKVGVFGITLEAVPATPVFERGRPWRIMNPEAVAKTEVAALKAAGAQIVIALAHLPDRDIDTLAKAVPGIDFVLGGNDAGMQEHPRRMGDSFVATAFSKGKYLSLLTLHLWRGKPPTAPFADRFQRAGLEKQVEQLEGQISSYQAIAEAREKSEKEAAEQKAEAPDPSRPARRSAGVTSEFYRNQIVRLRTQKADLEARLEDGPALDFAANYFAYEMVPVAKAIEDEPVVGKAVEAFRVKYPKEPGH
ncbi:MAG: hypothetical protein R3F39_16470 [Myxococcota bacterium]